MILRERICAAGRRMGGSGVLLRMGVISPL
jgi:hypothetical protein